MSPEIKEAILMAANYYGRPISEPVLRMYAEDLEGLDPRAVVKAYRQYRRNPKHTQFPLPAQIRSLIEPAQDDDSAARDAASRIIGAVRKHGYTQPQEAHAFIGEVGWSVVSRLGGWVALCQSMNDRDVPTLTAQFRDLATSVIKRTRMGQGDVPPALPAPEFKSLESFAGKLVKRIEGGA